MFKFGETNLGKNELHPRNRQTSAGIIELYG
jgi:hypothetical protein